jgi:DNA topoisomerase I
MLYSARAMGTMTGERWWRRAGTPEEGFRYLRADGRALARQDSLRRIERLAIPPGWTDVHVAPSAGRKIQAWGRDAAGRKQYIYSAAHVAAQDRRKWGRVVRFARELPRLRAATSAHLRTPGLGREKVLATMVRLMSRAFFRAGSERYAVVNRTYGICTLKKKHVGVRGNTLVFTYSGKRRIDQRRVVADTPLVAIIEELLELPGGRLFQYVDDCGRRRRITAGDVNAYLREILGAAYTSKDIRTFGGTVRAATVLAELGPAASKREARSNVVLCCRLVATELGNTPAICRQAYIHPAVLEHYERAGRTIEPLMRKTARAVHAEEPAQFYPEEAALLRFLERYG